jgi:hypothetical protein
MFLFFLPPVVQAVIGVVLIAAGVALHILVLAAVGVVGLAVGAARWARSRRRATQR